MQQTSHRQTPQPEWELLLRFLPARWDQEAKKLGAFTRARKVKSAEDLLRLVLMHAGVGLSLQRTTEAADHAGLAEMSKVAVFKRLRKCKSWLAWLVRKMLSTRVDCPQIASYRPRAVDGSTVTGPKGSVQLRLHYSMSLADLNCDGLLISDTHEAESLAHFNIAAGDLLIADRMYAKAKGIAHVKHSGGDVIVRLGCTSLTLYDEAGAKIERLPWLRELTPGRIGERFAQFRDEDGEWVRGRICAIPLSEAQAEKARKRRRKTARRTGQKLRDTTLEDAGYLCLFTTAEKDKLFVELVLELYRARWQVELAFKRLKSLLHADQLRDTSMESATIWLQGKMLYALLLHAYLDQAGAFSPWGYPLLPTGARQGARRSNHHAGVGLDRPGVSRSGAGDPGLESVESAELA